MYLIRSRQLLARSLKGTPSRSQGLELCHHCTASPDSHLGLLIFTKNAKMPTPREVFCIIAFAYFLTHLLALFRPNRAGNSTAVNLIRSEIQPNDGTVLLEGRTY
jgi:hypothetical protein